MQRAWHFLITHVRDFGYKGGKQDLIEHGHTGAQNSKKS